MDINFSDSTHGRVYDLGQEINFNVSMDTTYNSGGPQGASGTKGVNVLSRSPMTHHPNHPNSPNRCTGSVPCLDHYEEKLVEVPARLRLRRNPSQSFTSSLLLNQIYSSTSDSDDSLSRRNSPRKIQTSRVDVMVEKTDDEEDVESEVSEVSELNIVWGKTIDADEESSQSAVEDLVEFRSELHIDLSNPPVEDISLPVPPNSPALISLPNIPEEDGAETLDRGMVNTSDHSPLEHSGVLFHVGGEDTVGRDPKFVTVWTETEDEDESDVNVSSNASFGQCYAADSDDVSDFDHRIQFVSEFRSHRGKTVSLSSSFDDEDPKSLSSPTVVSPGSENKKITHRSSLRKKSIYKVSDLIVSLGSNRTPDSATKSLYVKLPENRSRRRSNEIFCSTLECPSPKNNVSVDDSGKELDEDRKVASSIRHSGVHKSDNSVHTIVYDRTPSKVVRNLYPSLNETPDTSSTERSEESVVPAKHSVHKVSPPHKTFPPYTLTSRLSRFGPSGTSNLSDSVGQMEDEASDGMPFTPIKPKKKKKVKKKKKSETPTESHDEDTCDMMRTVSEVVVGPTTSGVNDVIQEDLNTTPSVIDSLVSDSEKDNQSPVEDDVRNAFASDHDDAMENISVESDNGTPDDSASLGLKDSDEVIFPDVPGANVVSGDPESSTNVHDDNGATMTCTDDVDLDVEDVADNERRKRDTASIERCEEFLTPEPPKSVVSTALFQSRPILKPFKRYWNKDTIRDKRERNKSTIIIDDGESIKLPTAPSPDESSDIIDDPKRGQKRKIMPKVSHEQDQDGYIDIEGEDGGDSLVHIPGQDDSFIHDESDSGGHNDGCDNPRNYRSSLSEELKKFDETREVGEDSDEAFVNEDGSHHSEDNDDNNDDIENNIDTKDGDQEELGGQTANGDDTTPQGHHGPNQISLMSISGVETEIDRFEKIEIVESPVCIKRKSGPFPNDSVVIYGHVSPLPPQAPMFSYKDALIRGVEFGENMNDGKSNDIDDIDNDEEIDDNDQKLLIDEGDRDVYKDDDDVNVVHDEDDPVVIGDENDNVLFKVDDDNDVNEDDEMYALLQDENDIGVPKDKESDDGLYKNEDGNDEDNKDLCSDEYDDSILKDKDDEDNVDDKDVFKDDKNKDVCDDGDDKSMYKDDYNVYKDDDDNNSEDRSHDDEDPPTPSENVSTDVPGCIGQRERRENKEEIFFRQEEGDNDDLEVHSMTDDEDIDTYSEEKETDRSEIVIEERSETLLYKRPFENKESYRIGLGETVLEYSQPVPCPDIPRSMLDVDGQGETNNNIATKGNEEHGLNAGSQSQDNVVLLKDLGPDEDLPQMPTTSFNADPVESVSEIVESKVADNERASDSGKEEKKKGKKKGRKKKKKKKGVCADDVKTEGDAGSHNDSLDKADTKTRASGILEPEGQMELLKDIPDVTNVIEADRFSGRVKNISFGDRTEKDLLYGTDISREEETADNTLVLPDTLCAISIDMGDMDDSNAVKTDDFGSVDGKSEIHEGDSGPSASDGPLYVDRLEVHVVSDSPTKITISKQLLDDVISNKARAQQVVAEYPEAAFLDIPLASTTSDKEPITTLTQGSHLMSEMNRLEESARDQHDSLRLAVSEQEKYETEIRQLNASISEAQHKLQASPVLATSVGALKQQVAEHNTLAAQIKEFQEKVKEINDKSRELALNSALLSPSVFRKHYLPESAYSDFFSAASHHRANSPLPSSSPMNSDTVYTFDTLSPRSYGSVPEHSKEFIPKQSASLLSASHVPKSELMYAKVLHKTESPIQPSQAGVNESALTLDSPRLFQKKTADSSLSLSASFDTPPSSARGYESPLSSARGYETPLSSARSYDASPSSSRTIKGTFVIPIKSDKVPQMSKTLESGPLSIKTSESPFYQSPRDVSSFDSGMDSGTFTSSPYTLQSQPSPSASVSSMAEKLNRLHKDRNRPPPGGQPTELLRMQDSPDRHSSSLSSIKSDYDDTTVGTPRSTPRDSTLLSPRTPPLSSSQTSLTSPTPAKFMSPRLQALSTGWKSASDFNLAHSTPRSSVEYAKGREPSLTYSQSKVIKGTALIQSPRMNPLKAVAEESASLDPLALLRLDPPSETSTPRNKVGGTNPSKNVGSLSSPYSMTSLHIDFDSSTVTSNLKSSHPPTFSTVFPSPLTVSYPRRTHGNLKASLCVSSFTTSDTKDKGFQTSSSAPLHSVIAASFSTNSQPNPNRSNMTPKSSSSCSSDSSKYFDASSSFHLNPYHAYGGKGQSTHPDTTAVSSDRTASSNAAVASHASGRVSKAFLQLDSLDASPRERSSSFGAEVAPIGRPLGQAKDGSQTKDLDVSFNTLQEQVMSKEKELQASLQRQERYQHTVQELTAKMERAYMKLDQSPASVAAPLEAQIADHKATVSEIKSIKDDIAKVKDIIQNVVDTPNSDGQKAMDATLSMLNDRFNNLQTLADDKAQQLQEALKDREKHSIALKAYGSRVGDLKDWLEEAKVRQATSGVVSEEPQALKTQLEDNRELQEQVNARLQQLSDLALQCDALCDKLPPAQAEKLRNELASLQNQLGQFKMAAIEKQAKLRAAIKDAEKRKREMEELDSNVQRLQKWMSDTKEMTKPTVQQPVAIAPQFHKELATDLKEHKKLVRQLSKRGLRSARPATKSLSDKDVEESWERLSRELSQKTRALEDVLRTKKPGELVQVSLHAPARHADSSRQLGEVKKVLGDLGDCWDQLQTQLDEKQLQLDEALNFQQQYQSALQNVSGWLDLGQQQLFTVPSTTEEHIRQNENLQKELRSLGTEVAAMSEQGDDLIKSTGGANQGLIHSCLASLNNRIKLLEETVESQADDLKSASRQWKQYQDEVAELQQHLQETQKLVLAPSSTQSLDQLMSNNQNIEAQLKKCEAELKELKSKESALTKAYPKGVFPSELATLQSNYMELQRRAQEKKASLQKSVSVQDQYQKMLKDYASFVETAQDKLRNDSISARDLNHLKQQLTTHKDFFSDLEVHKAILDSLCSQCDEATRSKHRTENASLTSQTHVLVDQASLHGQRLERLTRQWTELDEKHIRLQRTLTSLEAQIPRPIASGDSLVTIQDKLSKYKSLQMELADERGTVFEVVDRGKQILHSINCPTLETAVADLAEKWVALNTDLTHELKRTETLGDQLSIFEAEAAVFVSWLSTAKMKNASFKTLSASDVQNIGAIRSKVEKVLEFRKEVENQAPLKNKVIKVGNELLQNKNYDTRGLSDRLRSFEEEWSQLQKGISETEEFLHQTQMELMPSRQALNELIAWIQEIKESLKDDAEKHVVGVADIEVMVKKYKGYKVELASKQMTLDFVNQSVLAPSPGEHDVSHEKLEFADKLGDLNKQWKDVVNAVDDRLDSLQGVQGKWEEYERAHQRLQSWIREQEDKIKRYKLIGQEVGVKQTIRDCKTMQQQLQHKQSDLNSINALGSNLIQLSKDSHGCQQSVRDSLSSLEQNWKRLEEQSRQLENLLTDILGQWARYHADLSSLNQVLTQTEYCLNQYTLVGGDISTLTSQVARLKGHKSDLENHSSHLNSFSSLANQLRQLCEPPVRLEIQKTVEDIQSKWKRLQADLSSRCCQFETCLSNWEEYESHYNKIRNWLDAKEQLCSDLITMRDDPKQRQESHRKSKELQSQLDDVQGQVSDLYRLSDLLTKNMNTSTIVILTSRQSAIEQRLLALRQILSQHMSTLSEDLSQLGQFNDAYEVVKKFLTYAESVLAKEDPTKAAESVDIQDRLDQLKRLLSQFMGNMVKLDHVNDLGYRLALNITDASRLHDLNHKWQDLYENTIERVRTLQGNLLSQQDFTSKCEAWMTFLAQTEQDLSTEIHTNLPGLRDQLRKCEQFESEMYSRQQILHAIISDGQKMMKAGEVEDKEEFQQKLQLLAEQWHSVSRRAHQRKAMIESLISQWKQFNSMSGQLQQWLRDKERAMKAFEFDSTSLQSVRTLVEKVKTTEREFKLQEASFKKIHDLGNNLIQRADADSAGEIRATLDDLQRSWFKVFSQLDDHRSRLEGVDRQWLECEEDIEDILNWLKDIRRVLHADIPTSYDDLQADLNKCKDIASSFVNSEDRRQRLLSKEKQLGRVVQADDLNLLHQRIRLLNKQWEELQHQTLIREQRLTEAMFRWNNLGDRIRSLLAWISNMEAKVTSTRDMHVEELLVKMETEYKDEMQEKEFEKNDICDHGQRLMKMSSEIRASDLEQKLLRVEDKWNHLKAVMDFRHRKLQETVLAVKQLDISMKNLSQWLAKMENELSSTIAYKGSNVREIQKKLHHTQEIQQDIEQHSAGVSAVLNLCEVLLHDSDACPTEVEFKALQHAMKNLEKRWKNICAMSPQRRSRVEETWQLWELFREDCQKFSTWLTQAERDVRDSEMDTSNISLAKEEIKKYENLQRKVHDQLSMLEHINRQYRHLAKEGRTDTDGSLKVMMTDLNNRWDALQLRVTEIMKRLRHSSSIRGDFESTHTSLMTWLTEVDMTLTNVESLDSLEWEDKLLEIQRIEDEVDTKHHRIAYLDQAAVYLMQKGDSQDALRVQQKLEEFRTFFKSVVERIVPMKLRIERMVVAENENQQDGLRSVTSAEDTIRELREAETVASLERQTAELEAYLEASPPPVRRRPDASPSRVAVSAAHRTGSPLRRAGAHLPRSRSSSPLRSSSPRRSFSPVRQVAATRGSRSPSRMAVDLVDTRRSRSPSPRLDIAQREKSAKIEILMEQLVESLDEANVKLARVEKAMTSHRPNSEHCMRLLVDCETAVDSVRRLDRLLKTETGVMTIASVDTQVKVVLDRWERLQKRAIEQDMRLSQERQDLIQLNNDLDSMLGWLGEAEALQSTHRSLPVDVAQLDLVVRQYKDFLVQLEAKKATILSINLISRNYMGSKSEGNRQLKSKLNDMNRRWDMVLARASDIQQKLQLALLQCQEFHQSINDYELWSEAIEAQVHQCEPLNLNADDTSLLSKYSKLHELHNELQRNQPKVQSLKETVDQLLVSSESPEMLTARDKAHIINNRVRSLLHLTSAYVSSLENRLKSPSKRGSASSSFDLSEGRSSGLGSSPASRSSTPLRVSAPTSSIRSRQRSPFTLTRQAHSFPQFVRTLVSSLLPSSRSQDEDNLTTDLESSNIARHQVRPSLLTRVIRTAIPIQLLLLLLLLLACLVPACEDDYSCLLCNNLRNSFTPMLRYIDGAPPV